MISYDSYENKIKKVARVKHGIHRFRFLIIGGLALLIAGVSVLIAMKGMVSGAIKLCDKNGRPLDGLSVTYGDAYSASGASAFMSDVRYEFAPAGSGEWTDIKPDLVGSYDVRAVSEKSFGGIGYSSVATFTIAPRRVIISVADGVSSMTYGDSPNTVLLDGANRTPISQITGHSAAREGLKFSYSFADDETRIASVGVDPATVKIVNNAGADFTNCYTVETETKDIELYSRNLTIDTEAFTTVYTGKEISFEAGANVRPLVEGDNISFEAKVLKGGAEITPIDADTYDLRVDASTVKITTGSGADVTRFYNFDKRINSAKLVIEKRKLVITTESKEKVYDGAPLSGGQPEIENLAEGHEAQVSEFSQTDANRIVGGETEKILNIPSITVLDGEGNPVTKNYDLENPENNFGTLTVKQYVMLGASEAVSLVYNGKPQESRAFRLDGDDFYEKFPEYVLSVAGATPATNVGEVDNVLRFTVADGTGADVTRNFDFTGFGAEKLTITKRPIKVATGDFDKMYDGQPNFEAGYSVGTVVVDEEGGYLPLADGHSLSDAVSSSLSTRVDATVDGEGNVYGIENVALFNVYISGNKSYFVTDNYDVTVVPGTLRIFPREITVRTAFERTFIYDGTNHTDPTYTTELNTRGLYTFDTRNGIILGEEEVALTNTGTIPSVKNVNDGKVVNELALTPNSNYKIINEIWGTISVEKRKISIKFDDVTLEYDGEKHYGTQFTTEYGGANYETEKPKGGIIAGDEEFIEVLNPKDITDVGYRSINPDIEDKSGNYSVISKYGGSLRIIPRKVLVVTNDASKPYDGTSLSDGGYTAYHAAYDVERGVYVDENGDPVKEGDYPAIIEGDAGFIGEDKLSLRFLQSITNVSQTYTGNNLCQYSKPSDNYDVTYKYGTLTITQREIEVSLLDYTRPYGDDWAYTNGVYDEATGKNYSPVEGKNDVASGDSLIISVSGIVGHESGERLLVGDYGIYALALGLKDTAGEGIYMIDYADGYLVGHTETENYLITVNSCTLTVEKRKITIVIDAPGDIPTDINGDPIEGKISELEYGQEIFPNTFANDVGYAEGEGIIPAFTYRRGDGVIPESDVKNAGTYFISLDIANSSIIRLGGDAKNYIDNYEIECSAEPFEIIPRKVRVKLDDFSAIYGDGYDYFDGERNYDEANSDGLSYSDLLSVNIVGYLQGGTEVTPDRVGEYSVFAKEINIVTDNGGGNGEPLKETYDTALIGGDFVALTGNYIITIECGALTITRRSIEITLDSIEKTYGDEFTYPATADNYASVRDLDEGKEGTYQTVGEIFAGDTLTVTVKVDVNGAIYDTFPVSTIPVGEHKIIAKTVTANGEAEITVEGVAETANYNITFVDGKLTVIPKQVEINLKSYAAVYGENYNYADNPALDGKEQQVSEIPNGEGDSLKIKTNFDDYKPYVDGRTETVYDVSKYVVTADSVEINGTVYKPDLLSGWGTHGVYTAEGGNYEITVTFGEVEITPRTIAVTTPTAEWIYDGTAHTDYENYKTRFCLKSGDPLPSEPETREGEEIKPGLLNDDKLAVIENTILNVTFVDPDGYKNTVRYTADGNYEIVGTTDGTLTIKPSEIELSLTDFSAVYGNEYDFVALGKTPNVSGMQSKNSDTVRLDAICYEDETGLPNVGGYTVKAQSVTITHKNSDGADTVWKYVFRLDVEGKWVSRLEGADEKYSNYKMRAYSANLEITKRAVTIEMKSMSGVYGTIFDYEAKDGNYKSLSTPLAYGDKLQLTTNYTGNTLKLPVGTHDIICTAIGVTGTPADGEKIKNDTATESFAVTGGASDAFKNYTFTVANTAITVTPKEITVELDQISSVVYGNALEFGGQTWTQDMVEGETLNIGVRFYEDEACTKEVTPKNAQTYYYKLVEEDCTVTENGVEIQDGVNNYAITCAKKTAEIERKAITVTVAGLTETGHNFTYGDIQTLDDVFGRVALAAQPDLVAGDALTVSAYCYGGSLNMPRNVGKYAVDVYSFTVTGTTNPDVDGNAAATTADYTRANLENPEVLTQNYEITFGAGEMEITRKALNINLVTDFTAVYGDKYSYTDGNNYDEANSDALMYSDEVLTITEVGYYKDNVVITPKYAGVYNIAARAFTIAPDEKSSAYEVAINAGSCIAQTQNYDITFGLGTFEITKREVTVTLNSYEEDYGEDYSYREVNGKLYTASVALGYDDKLTFTTNVDTFGALLPVGEHAIEMQTFALTDGSAENNDVAANYDLSWVDGTLTINKRKIFVKTPDGEWVYDGKAHSTEDGDYETFYYKDRNKAGIVDGEALGIVKKTEITHVWDEINGKEKNNVIEYSVGDNYEIVTESNEFGTLTVTQRKLEVELYIYEKEYGEDGSYKTHVGTGLYYKAVKYFADDGVSVLDSSIISGDTLEITTDYEDNSTKIPVGVYPIKAKSYKIGDKVYDATAEQSKCDFAITFVDGEITVTRAKAYVATVDTESTYGEKYEVSSNYSLTSGGAENSLKNGETLEFTYEYFVGGEWTETKPVRKGVYDVRVKSVKCSTDGAAVAVTYSGDDGAGKAETKNYEVEFVGATIDIKAREVTVDLKNYERVYGEDYIYPVDAKGNNLYDLAEGSVGLAEGDSLTFTVLYAGNAYADYLTEKLTVGDYAITVGSYTVSGTGDNGDYIVNFNAGNLKITPFTVRVFFTPNSAIACAYNDELDLSGRYGYNELPYGITATLDWITFDTGALHHFRIGNVEVNGTFGFAGSRDDPKKYDAFIELAYLTFKDGANSVANDNFKFEGELRDGIYLKIGELHVGTSEVTVTINWNVNSFVYGTEGYKDGANYTVSVAGLADGETLEIVYKFVDTTTREAFSAPRNAGRYEVQLDAENEAFRVLGEGANKNNYTFVINKTEIEIAKKQIYVAVADVNATYGDGYAADLQYVFTDESGNEIESPLVYGDTLEIDYSFSQGGEAVEKPRNAGVYDIAGGNARITAGQKKLDNYILGDIAGGELTIAAKKVDLTSVIEDRELTYGGLFTVETYLWTKADGAAYDDVITIVTATDYVQGDDVGEYKIFAGTVTDGRTNYGTDDNKLVWFAEGGNYEISLNVATLKVNEMTLTVTLDSGVGFAYGDNVNIAGRYVTADENGKSVPLTINSYTINGEEGGDNAVRYLNAGKYPVAITLGGCAIDGDKITNFKFETPVIEIGEVEIIAREITLQLATLENKDYGEQLVYGEDDYTVSTGNLVYGESLKVKVSFFSDEGVTAVSGNAPTDAGTYYYRLDKEGTALVAGENSAALLSNYEISCDKEWYTAEINRLKLVIALTEKAALYGDTTFETEMNYGADSGLKYGEILNVTMAYSQGGEALEYSEVKNVGVYDKTAASLKVGATNYLSDGNGVWTAEGGNYEFTVQDATLTVETFRLDLSALIENAEIVYGSAFTAPEYTVTESIPYGEKIVVTTATDYNTNDNAGGDYIIYASGVKVVADGYETEYSLVGGKWTAEGGNYEITLGEAALTVNKAALTVEIFDDEIEYGYVYTIADDKKHIKVNGKDILLADCAADGVYTVATGFGNGDTVSFTIETDREELSGIGDYYLKARIAASGFEIDENGKYEDVNYVITFTEGTLTVKPRKVTIEAPSTSFVYDGDTHRVANGYKIIGGVRPEHIALNNSLDNKTDVGNYELTTSGSATSIRTEIAIYDGAFGEDYLNHDLSANYEITNTVYGTMAITPRPVSVTVDDVSAVYGESYAFELNVEEFDAAGDRGMVATQSLSSFTLTYNGESEKPVNAGSYGVLVATVRVSTDGEDSVVVFENGAYRATTRNYVLTFNTANLEIAKRTVTIELADYSVVYGEDESYPTENGKKVYTALYNGAAENLPYGDEFDFTPVFAEFAGDHRPVGSYAITAPLENTSFVNGGNNVTGNYSYNVVAGELRITAKPVTVTLTDKEVTYGEAFVYDIDTVSASAPCGTVTVDGAYGETITLPVACPYTVGDAAGSTHTITASKQNVSGNYSVTIVTATLTVVQRSLTYKTGDATKIYDGTPLTSEHFFDVEGLVSGHKVLFASGSSQLNVGSTANDIVLKIYDATNTDVTSSYDVRCVQTGTLSVTARSISLTVTDGNSVTYNGSTQPFTGTAATDDEIANKENISFAYFKYARGDYNYTNTAPSNAGTYRVTFDTAAFNAANTNYVVDDENVTYSHSGYAEYTIDKAQCEFDLNGAIKTSLVYGDTSYDKTATLSSASGITLNVTIGYNAGLGETPDGPREVGVRYIAFAKTCDYGAESCVQTGRTDEEAVFSSDNYEFTIKNAEVRVTPKQITVTLENKTVTYGDDFVYGADNTVTVAGAYDETIILPVSCDYVVGDAAGSTHTITASTSAVGENYEITIVDATLTVEKRALTYKTGDATKIYDGSPLTSSDYFDVVGLVSGHSVIIASRTQITDVGSTPNNIGLTILDGNGIDVTSNYNVSTAVTGTLTVTARGLNLYVSAGANATYTGSQISFNGTVTAGAGEIVTGDKLNLGCFIYNTADGAAPVNAGTYRVTFDTAAFAADAANKNYTVESVTYDGGAAYVNFEIEKADLKLALDDFDGFATELSYGDAIPSSASLTVNGVKVEVTFTFGETAPRNVGGYTARVTGCTYNGTPLNATGTTATGVVYESDNYYISIADGNLTIKACEIEIVIENVDNWQYGEDYGETSRSVAGKYSDEIIVFATTDYEKTMGVGEYEITAQNVKVNGADCTLSDGVWSSADGNYKFTVTNGVLTVVARRINVIVSAGTDVTYNGKAQEFNGGVAAGDGEIVNGDEVDFAHFTYNTADGSAPVNAGTYEVKFDIDAFEAANPNYTVASVTYAVGGEYVSWEIAPRGVQVTFGSDSATYDGTEKKYKGSVTVGGAAEGETLKVLDSMIVYKLGSATVSGLPLDAGEYTVNLNKAAFAAEYKNYFVDADNIAKFTIAAATLEITPENATVTYGDNYDTTAARTVTGFGGDEISYNVETAYRAGDNVGEYAITVKDGSLKILRGGKDVSGNYSVQPFGEGKLTVTARKITVNLNDIEVDYSGNAFVFDTTDTAKYTVNGTFAGSDKLNLVVTFDKEPKNAGTYAMSGENSTVVAADGGAIAEGNYDLTVNGANLTINALKVVLSLELPSGYSLTFGEEFGYNLNDSDSTKITFRQPALLGGDTLSGVTIGLDGKPTVPTLDGKQLLQVGTYTVKTGEVEAELSSGVASNYKFVIQDSYSFSVKKAQVEGTIGDFEYEYGEVEAGDTASVTERILDGKFEVSLDVAFASDSATLPDVGTYEAYPQSADGYAFKKDGASYLCETDNYDLRYTSGTMTITRKAITVTISDATAQFGDTPEFDYTVGGLVLGDSATLDVVCKQNGIVVTPSAVGEYDLSYTNLLINGAAVKNYFVDGGTLGKLTVTPYTATFTAEDRKVTFGEAYTGETLTFENARLGTVTVTTATDYEAGDNVGNYLIYANGITVSGETFTQSGEDKSVWIADSGNCIVKFSATLVVERKVVEVTLDEEATSHEYDGRPQPYVGKVTVDGKEVTDLYAVVTFDRTPVEVGAYTVILTKAAFEAVYPNFTFDGDEITTTLRIVTKSVTVTISDGSAVYSGESLTYGGFKAEPAEHEDTLKSALKFTLGGETVTDVIKKGEYKVTFDTAAFTNYSITVNYEHGEYATFTVAKLDREFVLADATAQYGDTEFASSAILTSDGVSIVVSIAYEGEIKDVRDYVMYAAQINFAGKDYTGTPNGDGYEFTDAEGNFAFGVKSAKLTVEQRDVTFVSGDVNVGYGTSYDDYAGKLTGVCGSLAYDDGISSVSYKFYSDAACANEISAPTAAGVYYYKVDTDNVVFASGSAANYKFGAQAGKLSILKSQISVQVVGAPSFEYGKFDASKLEFETAVSDFEGNAIEGLDVQVNGCLFNGATSAWNAGTYTVTVSLDNLTVTDAKGVELSINDFDLANENTGSVKITKATLTVTVPDDTSSHVYSAEAQTYGGELDVDGLVSGDTFAGYTFVYKNAAGKNANPVNAGEYRVTLNTSKVANIALINQNYNLSVVYEGGKDYAAMSISKKDLTVTLGDETVVYSSGTANYRYTAYTYEGLADGDADPRYVRFAFTFTKDGVTSSTVSSVGEYKVAFDWNNCRVGSSNKKITDNYNVSGGDGEAKFTVAPKAVEFDVHDVTLTYNGGAFGVNGAMIPNVSDEFGSLETLAGYIKFYSDAACTNEISAPKDAGTYYAKYVYTGSDDTFVATANYDGGNTYATLTIEKIRLTLGIRGTGLLHDGTQYVSNLNGFTYEILDGEIVDGATDIITVSHNGGENPVFGNSYKITAALNSAYAKNYEAQDVCSTVTYVKGVVEVTVDDVANKVYDGAAKTLSYTINHKLGDTAQFIADNTGKVTSTVKLGDTAVSDIVNSGTYTVEPELAYAGSDFLVICKGKTIKIDKLQLTTGENFAYSTVGNTTFDYDGTAHTVASIFTVDTPDGFVVEIVEKNGRTIENAGGYDFTLRITLGGVDVTENFAFTFSEKVTVNKLKLYVGAVSKSAPYNGQPLVADTFRILGDTSAFTLSGVTAEAGIGYQSVTFKSGEAFLSIGDRTGNAITVGTTDNVLVTASRKNVRVTSVAVGDISGNFDFVMSNDGTYPDNSLFNAVLSFEEKEVNYTLKLPAGTVGKFDYTGTSLTIEQILAASGRTIDDLFVCTGLLAGHTVTAKIADMYLPDVYDEWLTFTVEDANGKDVTGCYEFKANAGAKIEIAFKTLNVNVSISESELAAAVADLESGVENGNMFVRGDGLFELNAANFALDTTDNIGKYHLVAVKTDGGIVLALAFETGMYADMYKVESVTFGGAASGYVCVVSRNSKGFILNAVAGV